MDVMELKELGRSLELQSRLHPPQIVEVPVQFPFKIRKAGWEVVETSGHRRIVQQQLAGQAGLFGFGYPVDPWQVREEFLALRRNEEALLKFLHKYGRWDREPPREMDAYWEVQDTLQELLLWPPAVRKLALQLGLITRKFLCTLVWEKGTPLWVVECESIMDALAASVQIDLVRRAKYRKCTRQDCQVVFSVTSRHKRKFCTQYCGHLVSLRRSRRKQHRIKKKRKTKQERGGIS